MGFDPWKWKKNSRPFLRVLRQIVYVSCMLEKQVVNQCVCRKILWFNVQSQKNFKCFESVRIRMIHPQDGKLTSPREGFCGWKYEMTHVLHIFLCTACAFFSHILWNITSIYKYFLFCLFLLTFFAYFAYILRSGVSGSICSFYQDGRNGSKDRMVWYGFLWPSWRKCGDWSRMLHKIMMQLLKFWFWFPPPLLCRTTTPR